MFAVMDAGHAPRETFWDGYVVNAVTDACYASARSKRWEPIHIERWQAAATEKILDSIPRHMIDGQELIKEEVMPDGKTKRLLHNPQTGRVTQQVV